LFKNGLALQFCLHGGNATTLPMALVMAVTYLTMNSVPVFRGVAFMARSLMRRTSSTMSHLHDML
jgi:hypothetical protein